MFMRCRVMRGRVCRIAWIPAVYAMEGLPVSFVGLDEKWEVTRLFLGDLKPHDIVPVDERVLKNLD